MEDRFHLWSSQRWMDKAGGDLVTGAWSAVVVFILALHAARTSTEDDGKHWENLLCVVCPIFLLGPYMLQAWLPYELYLRHRETFMVLMRVFFIVLAQAVEPIFFCSPGCGHGMRLWSGCVWGLLSSFGHRVRLTWHMALQVLWVSARVGCGMMPRGAGGARTLALDWGVIVAYACFDLLGTSLLVMVFEVRRRAAFLRAGEAAAHGWLPAANGEPAGETPSRRPGASVLEELHERSLPGSPLHPSQLGLDDVGVKAAVCGWMEELGRFNRSKVRCSTRGLVQVKMHDLHLEDQGADVLWEAERGVRRWAACPRGRSDGEGARRLMGASVYIGPGCIEVIAQTNSFHHWAQWQEWQEWQAFLNAHASRGAAGWEAERDEHRALYARWEAEQWMKRRARAEAEAQGAFITELMDAMPVAWMSGDVSIISGPSCFRFAGEENVSHAEVHRRPQIVALSPLSVPTGADAQVRVEWDVHKGDVLLCLRDGVRLDVRVTPTDGGALVAVPAAQVGGPGAIAFLVRAPVPGNGAQVASEVAPLLVLGDEATCDELAALGAPRMGAPSARGKADFWAEEPFLSSCALVLAGHDAATLGLSPAEVEEWERFAGSVVELACQNGLELLAEGLLRSLCASGCRPPVTLLHTAVWLGSERLARLLLEEFVVPVNVCAPSCGSITPLHVAALMDSTRMLDLLTRDQFGVACAARAMDAHGLTACDYAQRVGGLEHLSLLMRKAGWGGEEGEEEPAAGAEGEALGTPEVSEVSGVGAGTTAATSSPGASEEREEVSSGGGGRKRRASSPSHADKGRVVVHVSDGEGEHGEGEDVYSSSGCASSMCATDSASGGVASGPSQELRGDSVDRATSSADSLGRGSTSGISTSSYGDDLPGSASPVGVLPEEGWEPKGKKARQGGMEGGEAPSSRFNRLESM